MMPGASGIKCGAGIKIGPDPRQTVIVQMQQRFGHLPMAPGALGSPGFQHQAKGRVDLAQIMKR